jgi:IclR family mhp operon transcriptional activator
MDKGIPIRSISRSIAVLQAINRAGSLSMREIAQSSRIPYPTAFRIVQTLQFEGIIEREPERKNYRPTAMVRSLSTGFQEDDRLTVICRPHVRALTKKILWPLAVTTRVGFLMMVRDATNALTPLSFYNYHPGCTFPLLESAAGRVYLAHARDDERQDLLRGIKDNVVDFDRNALFKIEHGNLLREARERGVAVQQRGLFTATPGKTSAIAAPIFLNGGIYGAVSLIIFASAMTIQEAMDRYSGDLIETARRISAEFSDESDASGEPPVLLDAGEVVPRPIG